jgi:hypothetical protein
LPDGGVLRIKRGVRCDISLNNGAFSLRRSERFARKKFANPACLLDIGYE